jgi:hypothetical protein
VPLCSGGQQETLDDALIPDSKITQQLISEDNNQMGTNGLNITAPNTFDEKRPNTLGFDKESLNTGVGEPFDGSK